MSLEDNISNLVITARYIQMDLTIYVSASYREAHRMQRDIDSRRVPGVRAQES